MKSIKLIGSKKISTDDLIYLKSSDDYITLVDIINDKQNGNDFTNSGGHYLYELVINYDIRKIEQNDVSGLIVEVFDNNSENKINNIKSKHKDNKSFANILKKEIKEKRNEPITKFSINFNNLNFSNTLVTERFFLDKEIECHNNKFAKQIKLSNDVSSVVNFSSKENNKSELIADSIGKIFKHSNLHSSTSDYELNSNIDLVESRNSLIRSRADFNKNFNTKENTSIAASLKNTSFNFDEDIELGYEVYIESRIKNLKSHFTIDKDKLGLDTEHIFLKIYPQIRNSKSRGILELPTVYKANHSRQVRNILLPQVPPLIEKIKNQRGEVSFKVKQLDPVATHVSIGKTIFNEKNEEILNIHYGTFELGFDEKEIVLNDLNAGNNHPNSVKYKASAKYSDMEGPYSSIIFKGLSSNNIHSLIDKNIAIIALNEVDGIRIEISNIDENIKALELFRDDMSRVGTLKDRMIIVKNLDDEPVTVILNDVSKLIYEDKSVISNRNYRYFCVATLNGGLRKILSEDEIITRTVPIDELPLNVTIHNSEFVIHDDDYEFSVDVDTSLKETAFQFIKNVLVEQGADSEFLKEIENNRDELKNIVMFSVERVDTINGKRLSLGFHNSGRFVDNLTKSNSMLSFGRTYKYLFKACLVPPSTFLYGVKNRLSTGKKPGIKDIEYLANKFDNYVIRKSGVLPSNSFLTKKIDFESLMLMGDTGIVFEYELKVPDEVVSVSNLTIEPGKYRTKLSWEINDASLNKIDDFSIYVVLNNNKIKLGDVANTNSDGKMYFVDSKFSNFVGNKYYTVEANFIDNRPNIIIKSNDFRINSLNQDYYNLAIKDGRVLGTSVNRFSKE
jgi:hypothetical protein